MVHAKVLSVSRLVTVALVSLVFSVHGWASGPLFQVIHTFASGGDGEFPYASLIAKSGSLYGTTGAGGTYGNGCVFELVAPVSKGAGWTQTILYSFQSGTSDGQNPQAALLFDRSGNLYGSTSSGGTSGLGAVFELSPPLVSGGAWTETILYSFAQVGRNNTGASPTGLLWGPGGVLYGATRFGGAEAYGNVFELHPTLAGSEWLDKNLYVFTGNAGGQGPDYQGGLTSDMAGNLYGTTSYGGPYIGGQVFELSPPVTQGSAWTETVLYNFGGFVGDSQVPLGTLVFDASGNLYGTTASDGQYGYGTVFELTPPAAGGAPWTETILHNFKGGSDGSVPNNGVVFDKAGNLYGTTFFGGSLNSGTVFELSPSGGGTWSETVIHSFTGKSDGGTPFAGLMVDHLGNLYGTTAFGGNFGLGTVFRISP